MNYLNYNSNQEPWKASVIAYDIQPQGKTKKQTSFRLAIDSSNQSWILLKRYEDFKELHNKITKAFPRLKLIKLPNKKIFGNKFGHEFLKHRLQILDLFVKEVCSNSLLQLTKFVEQFFSLNMMEDSIATTTTTTTTITPTTTTTTTITTTTATTDYHAKLLMKKAIHRVSSSPHSNSINNSGSNKSSLNPSSLYRGEASSNSEGGGGPSPSKAVKSYKLTYSNCYPSQNVPSSISVIRSVLKRTLSFFTKARTSMSNGFLRLNAKSHRTSSLPSMNIIGDDSASPMSTRNTISNFYRKLTIHDFKLIKVIGKGSFGKVILAEFKYDGKMYAIKVISKALIKEETDFRHIMSERNILTQDLNHPFLIKLKCTFQSDTKLYIIMQYVNGGELFFHLQQESRFNEMRVKFYAAEIISAFHYLHARDIVYRDLKPENILLDAQGHVVLVDFGLAKDMFQLSSTTTFCGTPEYLAPEVILNHHYGKAVDWWCLGAVIYEMLVGIPPFYSKNRNEIFDKILYDDVEFPPGAMSPAAQDLISRLLRRTPCMRLGSGPNGSQQVMSHPFFEGVDWEKIYNKKYQPPYVPKLKTDYGLDNFDPEFLRESISPSVLNEPLHFSAHPSFSHSSSYYSSTHSTPMSATSTYRTCEDVTLALSQEQHPSSMLQFAGFSYANTIEVPAETLAKRVACN